MKKYSFLLITLLYCMFAKSQSVSYSITEDDPYNVKKTVIHLDPFYGDLWMTNMTLGWGVRIDHILNKKVNLNLAFRRSYLDMHSEGSSFDNRLMVPAMGGSNLIFVEPVVNFVLSDETSKKELKIVLSSSSYTSGNYTYTNTKYLYVPGTQRNVVSLRGGINYIDVAIDFSEGKAEKDFKAVDIKNKDRVVRFGDSRKSAGNSSLRKGYSMMQTTSLFAGLSYKTITNLRINADGWGRKRNSGLHDVYFDFMFAPIISYADIISVDQTIWNLSNTNQKRTGWRLGWQYRHPNTAWLSFESAFGMRPGYKGNDKGLLSNPRFFFDCTMGLSIPTNRF